MIGNVLLVLAGLAVYCFFIFVIWSMFYVAHQADVDRARAFKCFMAEKRYNRLVWARDVHGKINA